MAFHGHARYLASLRTFVPESFRMTTPRLFAVACLFAAGPFLHAQEPKPPVKPAPVATDAAAGRVPAGPVVGVVDLDKAIENYPRWIELQERVKAMSKQAEERMKQFQAKLEDARGTVKVTNPDSEEGKQAQFQLEITQQEGKFLYNALNEKLDAEQAKAMLAIFEDLEKAIPVVAKARGVSLVLRVHQVPKAPAGITEQRAITGRLRAFENKQVWFASEEVDLTPDLIKYLMVPRDGDKAATPPKNDAERKDGAGKPAETQQGSK